MLTAHDLTLGYPKTDDVIRGVSLSLDAGRIFSIVGPNGAGKSTLLAALAGIAKPKRGVVQFRGKALHEMNRRERARRIGYLPQTVRPSIAYTVEELVHLGRFAHGTGLAFETIDDHAAVHRALKQTNTLQLKNRLFSELSGGERQRVLTASVLAGEPEVILLDEPTASLDIGGSCGVFDTLKQLARDGHAVGVVTHDLNLAGQYSDDMILLSGGTITVSGSPQAVLSRAPLAQAYGGGFILVERPDSPVPAVLPRGEEASKWPR